MADAPTFRLAHTPGAQGDNSLAPTLRVATRPGRGHPVSGKRLPALLVSFFYSRRFLEHRQEYVFRDWALDSGAYSAKNTGAQIRLDDYIETCKRLLDTDPLLVEVFALDVIGDWKATVANTERMHAAGIPAIPTFHFGSPWDVLIGLARDYPKIALGGMVPLKGKKKERFIAECFARVWPKKIHGFGLARAGTLMKYPFHSVDATNWEIGPCQYGNWRHFGKGFSWRGSDQNLTVEIEYFLDLEEKMRFRWRREMQKLDEADLSLRLAYVSARKHGAWLGKKETKEEDDAKA